MELNRQILDIIKDIKDIDIQINNPTDEGVKEVILNVKNKLPIDTIMFEEKLSILSKGKLTNIDNVSFSELYNRLPYYRGLCVNYLMNICGKEVYKNLASEYKI